MSTKNKEEKRKTFNELIDGLTHENGELDRDRVLIDMQIRKHKNNIIRDLKNEIAYKKQEEETKLTILQKLAKMFF